MEICSGVPPICIKKLVVDWLGKFCDPLRKMDEMMSLVPDGRERVGERCGHRLPTIRRAKGSSVYSHCVVTLS